MRTTEPGSHFFPHQPAPGEIGLLAASGETAGGLLWGRNRTIPEGTQIVRLPNASTCSPSRRRTIQNNSAVSNASEIEVAAAAP